MMNRFLVALCIMMPLAVVGACSASPQADVALGSPESSSERVPSAASAPPAPASTGFPTSARYMADAQQGGRSMAIGISVDGGSVAAYACNGVDDEAWFFGGAERGTVRLTSKFRDKLSADVQGANVVGSVEMDGVSYPFTASPVTGSAGMYTAAVNNTRSSWIVRPDKSITAVQFDVGTTTRELEAAQRAGVDDTQFRDQVRDKRRLVPADSNVVLGNDSLTSKITGVDVVGVLVTGTFRLP